MIRNENIPGMAALAVEQIGEAINFIHDGDASRAVEALCGARTVINAYVISPIEKTTGETAYRGGDHK